MKKLSILIVLLTFIFISFYPKWVQGAQLQAKDLIIINIDRNEMAYIKKGKLIRIYKVATGSSLTPTPTGNFKIVNKIKNRPYYKGEIPGGAPNNPLGKRWLGLNINGTWGTTYAIHGNNNKKSIGKHVSAGCVRMYNSDIDWLFEHIDTGVPVIITKTKNNFALIANQNGYHMKINEKQMYTYKTTKFKIERLW